MLYLHVKSDRDAMMVIDALLGVFTSELVNRVIVMDIQRNAMEWLVFVRFVITSCDFHVHERSLSWIQKILLML